MASKGRILQLQHYSVNDGDGIRTTIFFAGCPLRCRWCANPEGLVPRNRILYASSRCIECGRCAEVCPHGVSWNFQEPGDRQRCIGCGDCVSVCLAGARRNTVTEYTVPEILQQLEPQIPVFRRSGGGVTYSGGECTQQPEFLAELVDAVYDLGLHQAIETSGYFDLSVLAPTLKKMDFLFMDIKVMDEEAHRRVTGVSNAPILHNIAAVGKWRKPIVIRVPVVSGINDSEENIRATARFVAASQETPMMELLPYHAYGADKYAQLGLPYQGDTFHAPTEENMKHLQAVIAEEGVQVVSYK